MVAAALTPLVLLFAVLFGTSWGRDQVRLTFTRLPDSYLEMYFDDPTVTARCPAAGSPWRLDVAFVNRSTDPRDVGWTASVTPLAPSGAASGPARAVASGDLALPALTGQITVVQVVAPSTDFRVEVVVPAEPGQRLSEQRLSALCRR